MMKQLRYWDSGCFLGWFNEEDDKVEKLRSIVKGATNGNIVLVTSTITLVEVFRLKDKPRISPENEKTIQAFFDNHFISLRNVTPEIGMLARKFLQKYEWLKPYDATHIATASHYHVPILDAFDNDILKLNNEADFSSIEIAIPILPVQTDIETYTQQD